MDRLEYIDAFHTRLLDFNQACSIPGAQILAAARFILALSDNADEMEFYLVGPATILIETLRDNPDSITDPGHITITNDALIVLQNSGQWDKDKLPSCLAHKPGSMSRGSASAEAKYTAGQMRSKDKHTGFTLVQVPVPIVCELPPVPGIEQIEYFGLSTEVTVAPRYSSSPEERIIWNNSNVNIQANRLRLLGDVAADVRMIARHTIYELVAHPEHKTAIGQLSRRNLDQMNIDRLGFELSLPDKEMPVAGASISLAVGAAMCGSMVGLARKGAALAPRSDLAWSGLLSPTGEVVAVEKYSLREKIRITSIAGLSGIVVARSQGDLACQYAAEVGWDGTVYTAGQLLDVFLHTELMRPVTLPRSIVHACSRPNLQRYSATALLGLFVLSLLFFSPRFLDGLGIFWFPPWRPAPTAAEIPNLSNFLHGFNLSIPRMDDIDIVPEGKRAFSFAHIVEEVCHYKDQGPYLILGESADFHSGQDGRLTIMNIPTRQVVGEYHPQSTWLPDDPGREDSANLYTLKQGIVADVDNDGEYEIVISISFNPTSLCVLQILEGDLRCERALKHSGHLEHLGVCDLNEDGKLEIVASGFHGPTDGMSLLIAEVADFYPTRDPQTPAPFSVYTTEELQWDVSRQPCYKHFILPYSEWMMAMPLDKPLMQLGFFTLAMPADHGASNRIRATATIGLSSSDLLLDFDFGPDSLYRIHDVFFGQVLINRINELIIEEALATTALDDLVRDVETAVYGSDYIWATRKPNGSR